MRLTNVRRIRKIKMNALALSYLNRKIDRLDPQNPIFLYKYRGFDKFAFDMLEHGYIYLCAAGKLDDPSECKVDLSIRDLFDVESGQLKMNCIKKILEMIKPYTSDANYLKVCNLVNDLSLPNGLVKRNILLEVADDLQQLVPSYNVAPIINLLGNLPEQFDDPKVKQYMEEMCVLAYNARKKMGICSLSEVKNSAEMWQNYADNYKGYCVEYDMRNYANADLLFPVIYDDQREINIVSNLVASFIGYMIKGLSSSTIQTDKSQFIRMFLTKDVKWSYQKEWRILGDADCRLISPKINAIYLGKDVTVVNKSQMIEYCAKKNIVCICKDLE